MENISTSIRYIVNDVEEAIPFYRDHLGFQVEAHPAPEFAALSNGSMRLLLNQPGSGGAGESASDGNSPQSGGWNRFQLMVSGLESLYLKLKEEGLAFKSEIIEGKGGRQVLLQDPSGNLVELFEPFAKGNIRDQ